MSSFYIFVDENEEFLKKGSKPVLLIESKGHALHAFVNQEFQGYLLIDANQMFREPCFFNIYKWLHRAKENPEEYNTLEAAQIAKNMKGEWLSGNFSMAKIAAVKSLLTVST